MGFYLGTSERFLSVNGKKYLVTTAFPGASYDVLSAFFVEESIVRNQTATLIVNTTLNVDSIIIENTAGKAQTFTLVSIENVNEVKQWTIKLKISVIGTRPYTIIGYGADGTSGATVVASIKVTLK